MISVARRNLFAERLRLALSASGVSFAVLLILILWSLYRGWNTQITSYIDSVPNTLWISQQGTQDMSHSVSLLPASIEAELRRIPGVAWVERSISRQIAFDFNGKEVTLYIVGYDPVSGIGGPVKIAAGMSQPGKGQIIIDRTFAKTKKVGIGDRLSIQGREFEIAGISAGGNRFVNTYAFIQREDAIALFGMEQFANFYLAGLAPDAKLVTVAAAIESRFPGVAAVSKAAFRETNRQLIDEVFLPIILVLVGIGFLVGVLVIGLTIYTATIEKSREYGVVKALGGTNGHLYRIVLEQALWTGTLGFATGLGLAVAALPLIQELLPSFVTTLESRDVAAIFAITLLMAVVASYVPTRRLVRLDPAAVFRA